MAFQKGDTYPNTGRTRFKKGCIAWNKGRTDLSKPTEETKKKISVALKGRPKTPEHIKNAANARIGIKLLPHTLETKLKISKALRGKKYNIKTKVHYKINGL